MFYMNIHTSLHYFLYVCLKDNDKCKDGWQSYNRNWEDAQKYLDIMCTQADTWYVFLEFLQYFFLTYYL